MPIAVRRRPISLRGLIRIKSMLHLKGRIIQWFESPFNILLTTIILMIFILYCIYLPKKFLVDAVESGNVTVVKLLLLLGVDPDVKRGLPLGDIDYGEQVPVITRAAMNGDKEIVRALINAGANVNAAGRYYQVSPLEGANMSKNNEIIRMLKVAGAKE